MTKKRKTRAVDKREYRDFFAKAREMAEHAKRFLEWVAGMLPQE